MVERRLISRIYKCIDCGRDFTRKELNRKFRCQDCCRKKMYAVIHQLHQHEGPEYERWKESIKAAAERL